MKGRLAFPAVVLLPMLTLTATGTAAEFDGFARCLARAGATYYAASWCPHCAAQDRMFGASLRYVRRVDCSRDGLMCARAGIDTYPTWLFAKGSRISGVQSLAQLGRETGCELSGQRGHTTSGDEDPAVARSVGGVRSRERRTGGALIVDIPGQ